MLAVMTNYRKSSHSVYDIKYRLVWITKYRKRVLSGEVGVRTRETLRQTCASLDVEIVKGHISQDHVHMLVSAPPHLSVSKLVQSLKGRSSRRLMMDFRTLKSKFWGRHLWARGYFVCTTGNVTDEIVKEYIENQELERGRDDDFRVEGEQARPTSRLSDD